MDEIAVVAERRKYDRLEKEIVFRYSLFEDLVNVSLGDQGLILDIGAGGVRFLSSCQWHKSDQLLMKLDFNGWRISGEECVATFRKEDCGSMLVVGTVMWAAETVHDDQFEIGVRFTARVQQHF
ncbi:MAG: hypothetical protein V1706_09610 [Pseudomonadota bacterium]